MEALEVLHNGVGGVSRPERVRVDVESLKRTLKQQHNGFSHPSIGSLKNYRSSGLKKDFSLASHLIVSFRMYFPLRLLFFFSNADSHDRMLRNNILCKYEKIQSEL